MLVIGSDDYPSSPLLSPGERAAVLWAEHVAKNTARERDDVLLEVKRYFTDAQIVELTSACGTFASSNRFQDSMGIPLEAPGEIDKIKRSLRVDAGRLKAYIGQLLEEWPVSFPVPPACAAGGAERAHEAVGSPVHLSPAAGRHSSLYGASLTHPAQISAAAAPACAIPLVDPASAQGEAALFIRASEQLFGGATNATLMWAHIPYIAKLWPPYQLVMEREGAGSVLPSRLRMIVLVRTAHLNRAGYSLAHRTALGRAAGLTDEHLHALSAQDTSGAAVFSERERVMLSWVDQVATNMAKRRSDLFDELRKHFDEGELVELTGLCAMANQVDLTLNALRVPLESDAEIEEINRSVRIDPARVRTYLETVYAHWPETFPA